MSRSVNRLGAAAGLAVATAAAGVAVGLVAQRRAARSILRRPDPEASEDFDAVYGVPRRLITDDGVDLYVEVAEPDDDRSADITVVFAHGYSLNATTWHYQLRDLRDAARLVVFDQRGHARSCPADNGDYSLKRLARDLAAVIEATAPQGPVVIVGHSMGGMAVMELADLFPEWFGDRIVAVALVATAASGGSSEDLAIAGPIGQLLHRAGPGLAALLAPRPEVIEHGLRVADDLVVILTEHYGFGSDAPPSLVEHTKRMHAQVPVEVLAAMLPAFAELDLDHALAPLQRAETTIVVGASDRMTPASLSQALVRSLPNADLLTLANTGHMLMLERYAEVNQVLRELLVRARRSSRAA